ncbi:peptide ABC transporter substrate-binding protein [Endozoicomonas numazuensis]|uniref:peptide ABC transporter substrate-binding protein n=1 Tax=Endozoicomonas numazuensis TaxID=1137799 RepID=UPI00068D9E31|nr:peptide ABC transporter substrate-binding protein [Endozoicomonas numazuensis]
MMIKRVSIKEVLLAVLVLFLSSTSVLSLADEPGTLVIGNSADPDSINPYNSQTIVGHHIQKNLFEGLIVKDRTGQFIPAQASNWSLSEDGKTYTFQLRPDLKWSNGAPLTAKDFVFATQYAINPDNTFIRAQIFETLHVTHATDIIQRKKPVESLGITAEDAQTLKIQLSKPVPYALDIIEYLLMPLHQASIEKDPKRWAQPGHLISNGAYQLDSWVINEQVTVVKNPHYWNQEKTKIDKAVFLPLQSDIEFKRYQTGEVHITANIPPKLYPKLKKTIPEQLRSHPTHAIYYYTLNIKNEKMNNQPLRQALSLAIDRELITDKITRQGETPAFTFSSSHFNDFEPPVLPKASLSKPDRIKEARRLYKEAGYEPEKPLEIEILYNTMDKHRQIALAISDMWKNTLGVKTRLNNMEFNSMLAEMQRGQFQVARVTWSVVSPEPCLVLELFKSDYAFNEGRYQNPEYDRLLEQACTGIPSPEFSQERKALFQRLERTLDEDVPAIPIYFNTQHHLVKPEVKGFPESGVIDDYFIRELSLEISPPR